LKRYTYPQGRDQRRRRCPSGLHHRCAVLPPLSATVKPSWPLPTAQGSGQTGAVAPALNPHRGATPAI